MKLSVLERILLVSILPVEGNFTNLKSLRVAREAISFNEKEHKLLNFRTENDQTTWDDTVEPKDITIGEIVTEIIKKELKELNDNSKLKDEQFTIYEKFVG